MLGSPIPDPWSLQNVPRQVLVADDVGEHAVDVGLVDDHGFLAHIRRLEGELVEQPVRSRFTLRINADP